MANVTEADREVAARFVRDFGHARVRDVEMCLRVLCATIRERAEAPCAPPEVPVLDDDGEVSCAHEWSYTGTQYGGDDERWGGEGRVLCTKCGADGDS